MLIFTYGSKTDAEMKLVLHGYTFMWLQANNRIWKLADITQRCAPSVLLEFMKLEDPSGYKQLLSDIGVQENEIPTMTEIAKRLEDGRLYEMTPDEEGKEAT